MGNKILTYPEIRKLSNVSDSNPLSILKIDCEGCEHPLFSSLAREKLLHLLPPQVVMEVHVVPDIHSFVKRGEISTYAEIFKILIDEGYAVFDNRVGDGGCEVSFVKLLSRSKDEIATKSRMKNTNSTINDFQKNRYISKYLENSFSILTDKNNAIDINKIVKLLDEYGVKTYGDLKFLDREHLTAISSHLKIVPKNKFLGNFLLN